MCALGFVSCWGILSGETLKTASLNLAVFSGFPKSSIFHHAFSIFFLQYGPWACLCYPEQCFV